MQHLELRVYDVSFVSFFDKLLKLLTLQIQNFLFLREC